MTSLSADSSRLTVHTDNPSLLKSLDKLDNLLKGYKSVVTAFSGGVDSTFLAIRARHILGPQHALAATANSPSLAVAELKDCAGLAARFDLSWVAVNTFELNNPLYAANNHDRCFYCKSELMDTLTPLAKALSAAVVLGVNSDDLKEYRPGQEAAKQAGGQFPLLEAGFTKQMIREASLLMDLPTHDKPAAPCLSSRVPNGTPITVTVLKKVAAAEANLRRLAIGNLRVRHHGELARIELGLEDLPVISARRAEVVAAVKNAGYKYVTLDLEGFRSGSTAAPKPIDTGTKDQVRQPVKTCP